MDKRLAKRHKRQVARAQERVKLSEPDVRTPEQIKAAREASRATMTPSSGGSVRNAPSSTGHSQGAGTGSSAKTAV